MALEDVVQGVNVKVTTDGVDAAKQQLAGLEKAIDSLAKQASGAAKGGGGGGVPDLTQAFSDLNIVSAQAFSQIVRAASSGDLTGIATMMGGPVAGGVAEATKSLFSFMETQSAAGLRNAAMAKQFGTTPGVMQDMSHAFEEAGVSGSGFGRLVNRMSRQVATDYPDMMRNVSESNLKAQKSALGLEEAHRAVLKSFSGDEPEKAAIRVQEANEKLQESYGVPKEAFAAQDKLMEQRKLQLAVADAIEAQDDADHKEQTKRAEAQIALASKQEEIRRQELNDVPHIAQMLSSGADVAEVSVKKLREAIEYMVNPSGPAKGVDVLAKEMDLIKTGAIDGGKAIELMQESMGRSASSGGTGGTGAQGLDASQLVDLAQKSGSDVIKQSQAGQGTITGLGLDQTPADTTNFKAFAASVSEAAGIWSALMQKLGSFMAQSVGTPAMKGIEKIGEAIGNFTQGKPVEGLKSLGSAFSDFEDVGKYNNEKPQGGAGAPKTSGFDYALGAPGAPGAPGGGGFLSTIGAIGSAAWQGITTNTAPAPGGGAPGGAIASEDGIVDALAQKAAQIAAVQIPSAIGTPAAAAPGGIPVHWGGGPIRIPGFSRGGRVRIPGFADGGYYKDKLSEAYSGYAMGRAGEGAVNAGLGLAGITARAAVGTVGGVLSNPLGIGLLDASPVAAADRHSGAAQEEAYGRSIGAHNQREMYELQKQGAGIQMWEGGIILGFDDGGDPIAKAQKAVSEAEFQVSQNPNDPNAKFYLAVAKKDLADLMADVNSAKRAKDAQREQQNTIKAAQGRGDRANESRGKIDDFMKANPGKTLPGALSRNRDRTDRDETQGFWIGGIPGFAMGSVDGPGTGTSDSIVARLSAGEFVMKDAAVRNYGEGFMHAINDMRVPAPKYAMGGMIPASALPHFAAGGGVERPGSILNLHIGDQSFNGLRAPDAVAAQLKKFAIGQQTTSTGRKPSWAGG